MHVGEDGHGYDQHVDIDGHQDGEAEGQKKAILEILKGRRHDAEGRGACCVAIRGKKRLT